MLNCCYSSSTTNALNCTISINYNTSPEAPEHNKCNIIVITTLNLTMT